MVMKNKRRIYATNFEIQIKKAAGQGGLFVV